MSNTKYFVIGLQGSGKNTFITRAKYHNIPAMNIHEFDQRMTTFKKAYTNILGPSGSRQRCDVPEYKTMVQQEFDTVYKNMISNESWKESFFRNYNLQEPTIMTLPCPLTAVTIIDNYPEDDNKYILISSPLETNIDRVIARQVPTDPRLRGKSNYEFLVRPEIEAELTARTQYVEYLMDKVDYHIHNDGELNQYYAAIDQVLNAENLLN